MGTLRVGLVGYGLAGESFHAPLIDAVDGLRLDAIVTASPERAARAAARHPGARVLPDADALWATRPDLAVIATPNRSHAPLARAALAAGIPTVVDKPLAVTAAEGAALAEEFAARGVPLTVFQNRRWDGDFLTVRRLLAEGALGEVHRFESRFERWRPLPKAGWREQGDPAEGGGVLADLGSHLIDQARVLFGPVATVYAELDRRRAGVEVEDDAFVALTHAGGVRSHLWMGSLAAEHSLRFRVLGSRAGYRKEGTDVQEAALRGGARAEGSSWGEEPVDLWGRLGAGEEWRAVRTEPGDYRAFYAALREGGPPPVHPGDAVAVLRVIEAARVSAREARVVELGGG